MLWGRRVNLAVWLVVLIGGSPAGCGGATRHDGSSISTGDAASGGQLGVGGGDSTGGSDLAGGASGTGGSEGMAGASESAGEGGAAGRAGTSGEGGGAGAPPDPLIPFMIVRIERGPANGYCVTPGQILSGGAVYGETGDFSASGIVFREWVGEPPECYAESDDPECYASESFAALLSDDQVAELDELVQALPEDRCEPDPPLLCDPCVITTIEIDTDVYVDHCCGTQASPGYAEAFQALADYLDSLVPAPAPCAGEDLNVTLVNEFGEEYRLDGTATDPGVSAVIRQNVVHVEVFEEGGWYLTLNVDTNFGEITIDWEDNNEWGYEALSTDYGGPYEDVTIVRSEGPGGVVEGNFENVDLGYSYEGREMTVSGSFRACVEAL